MNEKVLKLLVHLLAEVMPDVLNKERREEWLEFAIRTDCLCFEVEDRLHNLWISQESRIGLLDHMDRRLSHETVSVEIYVLTPKLSRIIHNSSVTLTFEDDHVRMEGSISQSFNKFSIHYDHLPWLAIHALQANPGSMKL